MHKCLKPLNTYGKYQLMFKQIKYMYLDHLNDGKSLHKLCDEGLSKQTAIEMETVLREIKKIWTNPEINRTISSILNPKTVDSAFYVDYLDTLL